MTRSLHEQVLGKGFQLLGNESQFIFKYRTLCCGPYGLPEEHLAEPLGQTTLYPSDLCTRSHFWSTGLCAASHLLVQISPYWWGKEISLFELVYVYLFGELSSLCYFPHFDADFSVHGFWGNEAVAKGFQISQFTFCLADCVHPHVAVKGIRHPHVALKGVAASTRGTEGVKASTRGNEGVAASTRGTEGVTALRWKKKKEKKAQGHALKQATFIIVVIECW